MTTKKFVLGLLVGVCAVLVLFVVPAVISVVDAGTCGMRSCGGADASCAATKTTCAMSAGGAGGGKAETFLSPYFEMRKVLASDKAKGIGKLSAKLAEETKKLQKRLVKEKAAPEQLEALKKIEGAASSMKAEKLVQARERFKVLSREVLAYVKSYGYGGPAYVFYCDMVKESWLQETDKVGNPYYGSEMLGCGTMMGHVACGKYMAGKPQAAKSHH
ncbi:MAG: DUF3347 domain-containing protein [Candidatus Eisenbacteria bacterium]